MEYNLRNQGEAIDELLEEFEIESKFEELTIIKDNCDDCEEDVYVLCKTPNSEFIIIKNCLASLGWHHVWEFANLCEANKEFEELVIEEEECHVHNLI